MFPPSFQYGSPQWAPPLAGLAYGQFLYTANTAVVIASSGGGKAARKRIGFAHPSLQEEKRTHVGTACAAHWLGRKPQTLRAWACFEDGPLRPTRVNGRLAWSVADIRRVLLGANHDR